MESSKSWLEISERRLRHNYATLASAAAAGCSDASVLAVVKAGAYGHGAEVCAPVLAAAGAEWMGVADAAEGAAIRRALDRNPPSREAQPRILVMCGPLPGDADLLAENHLTPVVWTSDQLDWLARGARPDASLQIHLEIDTGMSRQGVLPGPPLDHLLDHLLTLPGLRLDGVLTHFASAEICGSSLTRSQQGRFRTALAQIYSRNLHPRWVHAGSSSTVDEAHCLPWLQGIATRYGARPLVRSGIALYGYCLPLSGGCSNLQNLLQPVLAWKTRILSLQDVAAGATVGYNATFTASQPMRLALLPIGYADGLRRELSSAGQNSGGWVVLHGRRAPIVGRISMNLTTVDASGIPNATPGDEVTVLGDDVTADEHARLAGTIAYEILCGLRARPRLTA